MDELSRNAFEDRVVCKERIGWWLSTTLSLRKPDEGIHTTHLLPWSCWYLMQAWAPDWSLVTRIQRNWDWADVEANWRNTRQPGARIEGMIKLKHYDRIENGSHRWVQVKSSDLTWNAYIIISDLWDRVQWAKTLCFNCEIEGLPHLILDRLRVVRVRLITW